MKMKINRACDLNSISVLPPHCRPNNVPVRAQSSQIQSQQQSQHSFSQGFSSQHGIFSQLSQDQNSLDEVLTNDQERESCARKNSSTALVNHTKEENHLPISRYSANFMRKWGPAASSESKCQVSEDLDHKIGSLEASLVRFGIILDSIQSDVMQVNKRTKEITLEVESVQQKLINQDSSLHLLQKTQIDVKAGVEGWLKSISEQPDNGKVEDKLQDVLSQLSSLPVYIEGLMPKLEDRITHAFTKEMQGALSVLGKSDKFLEAPPVCPSKAILNSATPGRRLQRLSVSSARAVVSEEGKTETVVKMAGWKSVKKQKAISTDKLPAKELKAFEISSIGEVKAKRRDHGVVTESDEEINSGFLCLIKDKEEASSISNEIKVETEQILRRARRRKRKSSKTIFID